MTPLTDRLRTVAEERQTSVVFATGTSSAGKAREHARRTLAAWNMPRPDLTHDVELVVSELVTNALRHGQGQIGLRLGMEAEPDGRRMLRIEVSDASPRPPRRQRAGRRTTGGRGLVVVEALADQWGVDLRPGGGKTVWAQCVVEKGR